MLIKVIKDKIDIKEEISINKAKILNIKRLDLYYLTLNLDSRALKSINSEIRIYINSVRIILYNLIYFSLIS